MTRKIFGYTILTLLCYLFQYVWIPLRWNTVVPDFLLLLTVACAVRDEERTAAFVGLAAGLLSDYSGGGVFGLRGISFMLIGYFLSRLVDAAFSSGFLTALVAVLPVFLLTRILYWGGQLVVKGLFPVGDMLRYVTLPELILTLPFCPVLFGAVCLASPGRNGKITERRRREDRL